MVPKAQLEGASDFESGSQGFEFRPARHFGTELGTPKPAVFALEAATSVLRSALFDPMMRNSF
jgi:predicted flavoprotein YhiN